MSGQAKRSLSNPVVGKAEDDAPANECADQAQLERTIVEKTVAEKSAPERTAPEKSRAEQPKETPKPEQREKDNQNAMAAIEDRVLRISAAATNSRGLSPDITMTSIKVIDNRVRPRGKRHSSRSKRKSKQLDDPVADSPNRSAGAGKRIAAEDENQQRKSSAPQSQPPSKQYSASKSREPHSIATCAGNSESFEKRCLDSDLEELSYLIPQVGYIV